MIYVLTGGAGFIGLNTIRKILAEGDADIRIVDDLSNSNIERLDMTLATLGGVSRTAGSLVEWLVDRPSGRSRVTLHTGDIRDFDLALSVCQEADLVLHLAAQTGVPNSLVSPRQDLELNVLGTFNYLEASRQAGVPKFVLASSAAVLGNNPPPQIEERPTRPVSPYGASKGSAEAYLSAYYGSFGVRTLALRFSNVYGPLSWAKGSVVAAFCKSLMAGKPLTIFGDGSQTRDFLHVDDLVAAMLGLTRLDDASGAGVYGKAVNIATGVQTRVLDLAGIIKAQASARGRSCQVEHAAPRPGDVHASAPDTAFLRGLLPGQGFRSIEDGIPGTLDWFIEAFGRNTGRA